MPPKIMQRLFVRKPRRTPVPLVLEHISPVRCLLVCLFVGALFCVTGCGLFHKKAPQVTYDDPQITAKVESVLKSEPSLKDNRITIHSNNGVVELSGEVDSIATKERAGLIAAAIPGIAQVKNDLLVRRPAQTTH